MHTLAMKRELYNICYSSYALNTLIFMFKAGIAQNNKYEQ